MTLNGSQELAQPKFWIGTQWAKQWQWVKQWA